MFGLDVPCPQELRIHGVNHFAILKSGDPRNQEITNLLFEIGSCPGLKPLELKELQHLVDTTIFKRRKHFAHINIKDYHCFNSQKNKVMANVNCRKKEIQEPLVIFLQVVGAFNPFETYQSKWESSPHRGENKNL